MASFLLKLQLGPVQDFIAAARSTRDLWSGSYLLSWLMAAGIRELQNKNGTLIYPNPEGQPLLKLPKLPDSHEGLLTPNLPNLFVAKLESVGGESAVEVIKAVESAIRKEWRDIADSVWRQVVELKIVDEKKKGAFDCTVDNHLAIAWQVTPLTDDNYNEGYKNNGWHLDAVRQTRVFEAQNKGRWWSGVEKDSLTGKEESLCGGTDFQKRMGKRNGEIYSLFKHSDEVGAITLIKRIWHITWLSDRQKIKSRSKQFKIRSIPAIASRTDKLDDDSDKSETGDENKYFAAIAFDGDQIGKWVSGEKLKKEDLEDPHTDLEVHHKNFSATLSEFALKSARKVVEDPISEGSKIPLGQLIYSGGDDVVCLVPADAALETAAKLREEFCTATTGIKGGDGSHPDASAGIAIGHVHAPLQDMIQAAQQAEKRAKKVIGRPAFSVRLMKRSGEISDWGSKWESHGIDLYKKIVSLMQADKLSSRFPHRVITLLEPYVTVNKGLGRQQDAIHEFELAQDLITQEFSHAVTRQGKRLTSSEEGELITLLEKYLQSIQDEHKNKIDEQEREKAELAEKIASQRAAVQQRSSKIESGEEMPSRKSLTQELLTSLIGLCTTVGFSHRTRSDNAVPEESQLAKTPV